MRKIRGSVFLDSKPKAHFVQTRVILIIFMKEQEFVTIYQITTYKFVLFVFYIIIDLFERIWQR